MKQAITRIVASALMVLPAAAMAAEEPLDLGAATGLSATATKAGFGTSTDVATISADLIQTLLGLSGLILILLLTYAGFIWATSQGDSEKIKKAKGILKNAILGLILMMGAYVLTATLVNVLTKA